MLSIEIRRHMPTALGNETRVVGRLDINMASFVHIEGKDGGTPFINEFGYWQIGDTDTGIKAQGPQGIQGRPVPVAQVLGQSTTDAVSQKLLTDTVGNLATVLDRINGVVV